jgi:hypothetical protein
VRRQVTQELHNGGTGATALGRRLLRRPTTAETERIARGCPPEGLSIPVIVDAFDEKPDARVRPHIEPSQMPLLRMSFVGRRTKARERPDLPALLGVCHGGAGRPSLFAMRPHADVQAHPAS